MKDTITIPTPRIDTGPSRGAFPQQDAADYLEEVRARFGQETSHGKGVRGLVDSLLADVVRAIRALEPAAAAGRPAPAGPPGTTRVWGCRNAHGGHFETETEQEARDIARGTGYPVRSYFRTEWADS